MKAFRPLLLLALVLAPALRGGAQAPTAASLLAELQQVAPDELQTFKVTDLYLRRDAVRLHLQHGTLVFLRPVAGRVTGAIFEGGGEVLVVPPDAAERQQLVKFTGAPILTESFASLYLRFSDDSFQELQAQIRSGRGRRVHQPDLAARWSALLPALNRPHSLRLLLDYVDAAAPYFYAGVEGQRVGAFNLVVDDRRFEQVLVGQQRWWQNRPFYDVWCSFARQGGPAPPLPVRALAYRIRTTLTPTQELEADCEVDLELQPSHPHALLFELSRFLSVSEVAELASPEATPVPLEFFQNTALSAEEARYRGTDVVAVVLPPSDGGSGPETRTLRFRYRGQVISDLGNGVLFVGARGRWYPVINTFYPSQFELRFRTPRPLKLVATGTLRSSREEGDWKEWLWVSEVPLPVAGFNVGDYESREVVRGDVHITAHANRQLEPGLARAARRPPLPARPPSPPDDLWNVLPPASQPKPTPPTFLLEQVANDVANALATFSDLFGPYRYHSLEVSPIPGSFGQGYPGLLYLSTFSFLPEADQARMGVSERARALFSQVTPAHETAHQWWGNWVRVPFYRDQWLAESLASYSALLYLERQPEGADVVRQWLERYRNDLLQTNADGQRLEVTGALSLGQRLDSSRSPQGYASLVYSKGPWVIHMLRELFRDPATGSDEVFLGVLRGLAEHGHDEPLTTAAFQKALEAVLPEHADAEKTGRLDWFFLEWVGDTGLPRYRLDWKARKVPSEGWQVEGAIAQSEVSELFTMPLPVYARFGARLERLGTVIMTGEEVAFRFPVKSKPDAVLLDPHNTVLRLPD